MKAIVTGGTGYIGSHLVKLLLSNGWKVAVIADSKFGYGNIEDIIDQIEIFEYYGEIASLISFFQAFHADVVFHLAAAVITNPSPDQIPILVNSNIRFGTEILEAMALSKTRLIITTGTYWQNLNGKEYNPVDLYAATKEAFEKILKFYTEAKDIRAISLRLYDVYGEDDKRPKIWNLLKEIAGTEKSIDMSPGEQFLDLVHVNDVSKAFISAYEYLIENRNLRNEIFGVFSGNQKSLKDWVIEYEKYIGKPFKINWGAKSYKLREVMFPNKKLNKLPNWNPNLMIFSKLHTPPGVNKNFKCRWHLKNLSVA